MDKTIKEWFETIEDPEIRAKAIANTNPDRLALSNDSLVSSLYDAFAWNRSPEKHQYWATFKLKLESK
jgi:hypothetical protein